MLDSCSDEFQIQIPLRSISAPVLVDCHRHRHQYRWRKHDLAVPAHLGERKIESAAHTVATLISINAGTGLFASFLAGTLADKVGRKAVMVFSLAMNGIAYLFLMRAETYPQFVTRMIFELLPQDPYPDLQERSVKAAWRNARVITPRVGDTVRLVPVIRALDNALNSIRLRAEDLTPYVKHFQAVDELVVALHDVIGHVARVTVTEYEPRGAVKAFLNQ